MEPAAQLIEARQVTKIYQTGSVALRALRGITLSIGRGEFVALMGPSGSGKSTFLNIVGCLDQPTEGIYQLDGVDVSRLERNQLAAIRNEKLGFVFQNFNLLPRTTAVDNVELPLLYRHGPPVDRKALALEALRMVGLADYSLHHPNQLSGGQQQRVAIARALVNAPEIFLADEPTGALDSRTSIEIMAIFQKLNRESGITLVMVTHEPDIAAHAGRILRFRDGLIMDDRKIAAPRDAARELLTMPLVESEAESGAESEAASEAEAIA
jgi:putative ABC transport system ATP-binding protein